METSSLQTVIDIQLEEEEIVRLTCHDHERCKGHEIPRSWAEVSTTLRNMLAGRSYGGFCIDEDEEDENVITLYLDFVPCPLLSVVCEYLQYKYHFENIDFKQPEAVVPPDFGLDLDRETLYHLFILSDFLQC